MIDRDDWSQRELMEAEGYATTCDSVLRHILSELRSIEVVLSPDKRASVEISALLEAAARIAQERLGFDADDFAVTACDVFMRT
ncbi:hypothetical protein [Bradyrhizobium japonicum]|uniref:hypothetical protein n=1 Tax=Bradyrhizobium japonicum TaxID=375 RepID=UPI00209D7394|nr:hypothetical protein [Bradyrhizobium japonicum]MCP1778806.1 hypothetical protein [Bradyrhizobium japonicum]MCP1958196.1 hypothetical protein [Bradyrhizobium japonicum]